MKLENIILSQSQSQKTMYLLYDSIYMKYLESLKIESRFMVA